VRDMPEACTGKKDGPWPKLDPHISVPSVSELGAIQLVQRGQRFAARPATLSAAEQAYARLRKNPGLRRGARQFGSCTTTVRRLGRGEASYRAAARAWPTYPVWHTPWTSAGTARPGRSGAR